MRSLSTLQHKEHRLITIVGVALVVITIIFAVITVQPGDFQSSMVAISLHLLTIALILILTGFFVEVVHKLNEEKKELMETERLIKEKLSISPPAPIQKEPAPKKKKGKKHK